MLCKINAHDFKTNTEQLLEKCIAKNSKLMIFFKNKINYLIYFPFLFIIFFLEELVLRVLHVLPRTWLLLFLKPSKPIKTEDQNQIKPIKRIYPSNANQTHHQSQPPPTPPSSHIKPTVDQPIKPTTNQPIHHHRVSKSRN